MGRKEIRKFNSKFMVGSNIGGIFIDREQAFAVKNKDGLYYIGLHQFAKQLRKAKLYHSYKWAKEVVDKPEMMEQDCYIVHVDTIEGGVCDYD